MLAAGLREVEKLAAIRIAAHFDEPLRLFSGRSTASGRSVDMRVTRRAAWSPVIGQLDQGLQVFRRGEEV
jgi:hypothetical protein